MGDDIRYAFIVEWYEELAARVRRFQLFYFAKSQKVEMYDINTRKKFLSGNLADSPIELQNLHIGSPVNILSRQLIIVDYGDDFTRRILENKNERTLALIKPDTLGKMGDIIDTIHCRGLLISKMKLCRLDKNDATKFYQEHAGKSFMNALLNYVTSGPVLAMDLVGENAVQRWREIIGPTDPTAARSEVATSLRARFGKDVTHNAVHGSDSPASAFRESELFFPSDSKHNLSNCRSEYGSTCCIIKPHAVKAGVSGKIINAIQEAGYTVNTIQMFHLEKANAEEFYEVYKGVVHEYPGMVNELCSGPLIAMQIIGKGENTPEAFRETSGPLDPEIARHLRPRTLRALFGRDKVQNAVHCTDLPEDAGLEVEYFFKLLDS